MKTALLTIRLLAAAAMIAALPACASSQKTCPATGKACATSQKCPKTGQKCCAVKKTCPPDCQKPCCKKS